jgi:hypothetical protein
LYSEFSAEHFRWWVVQRILSRALHLLSCSANSQQGASAAELFSEFSAGRFSCWVVQRILKRRFSYWVVQGILSRELQLLSYSVSYQQNSSAAELFSELSAGRFNCWVVQRILSRALQVLSCSANYQRSSSAANFSELTAQHLSCWVVQRTIITAHELSPSATYQSRTPNYRVVQRTIRTALQLPPSIFTSNWVLRIPSRPSLLYALSTLLYSHPAPLLQSTRHFPSVTCCTVNTPEFSYRVSVIYQFQSLNWTGLGWDFSPRVSLQSTPGCQASRVAIKQTFFTSKLGVWTYFPCFIDIFYSIRMQGCVLMAIPSIWCNFITTVYLDIRAILPAWLWFPMKNSLLFEPVSKKKFSSSLTTEQEDWCQCDG